MRREGHPTDRRAVVVIATPDADVEVRATFGALHDAMIDAVDELSAAELRTVHAFLERMRAVVDEAGPSDGDPAVAARR